MKIIVQKFGGTSLADSEKRKLAAKKIVQAKKNGYKPIIVVSAMGRKGENYATDTLIDIGKKSNINISKRELDQIMQCGEIISAVVMTGTLQAIGINAVMLTGGQAGIITDDNFNNAHILKVDTTLLTKLLQNGKTPVVCGFQGITTDHELTTLGRGGSDTTAAAIGVALNADLIEIFTDVEGIMTADPRIVNNAKILKTINYEEACQLAQRGAKVIHPRSVEIAMQKNIPIAVKSTFSEATGTIIKNVVKKPVISSSIISDRIVIGVTCINNIVQFKININNRKKSNNSSKIFRIMADNCISVDMININAENTIFTIMDEMTHMAKRKLCEQGYNVVIEKECAKISIIGAGMNGIPGVMATLTETLASKNIDILQTVDSNTSISVLIKNSKIEVANNALHKKFFSDKK